MYKAKLRGWDKYRKNRGYFDPNIQYISLRFDDGSIGQALVQKASWGNCPHLIDECIGLWELKLNSRIVKVYLEVVQDKKIFYVSKRHTQSSKCETGKAFADKIWMK